MEEIETCLCHDHKDKGPFKITWYKLATLATGSTNLLFCYIFIRKPHYRSDFGLPFQWK